MGAREKQCRREGNKTYIGRRCGRGCEQRVAAAQEWVRRLAWAIGWCSHAALAVPQWCPLAAAAPVPVVTASRAGRGGRPQALRGPPRPPCAAGRPAGIIHRQLVEPPGA